MIKRPDNLGVIFLAIAWFLVLMGGTTARAQNNIATLATMAHSAPASFVPSSSLDVSSVQVTVLLAHTSEGGTPTLERGDHFGSGTASSNGSQDEPYTNFRVADHYLRSATVLIVRLPSSPACARPHTSANPAAPRAPPTYLPNRCIV